MSNPHRATPEQWKFVERFVEECGYDSCLLELRDRLQSAEQRISELEGNSSAGLTSSAREEIREAEVFGLVPAADSPQLTSALLRNADESEHELAGRLLKAGWDAAVAARNLHQQDEDAERPGCACSPAGSLVEVVEDALMREDWLNNGLDESVCGDDDPNYRYTSSACNSGHGVQTLQARAAILTCALWLEQLDVAPALQAARWLREEVERHG